MKKFQKTTQPILRSQWTVSEKPKVDFITLLPQILKIFPQLNINNLFSPPKNTPDVRTAQKTPNTSSLMKTENTKTVINSIETHKQKVKEINT